MSKRDPYRLAANPCDHALRLLHRNLTRRIQTAERAGDDDAAEALERRRQHVSALIGLRLHLREIEASRQRAADGTWYRDRY